VFAEPRSIQRKNKAGLVSELPPAIDQVLVTSGLKGNSGRSSFQR